MMKVTDALQEHIARAICLSKQRRGDTDDIAAQYVDTFWRDYLPEAGIAVAVLENQFPGLADAIQKDTAKDSELAEARAALAEAERDRDEHAGFCADAIEQRAAAEARSADLETALEPFAKIADLIALETEGFSDTDNLNMFVDESDYLLDRIKVGDLRRARTVLSREKEARA